MKIANVNIKDTGNQCYKLSKAVNQTFTGIHESRGFICKQGYTLFPYDVRKKELWKIDGFPNWIVDYWANCDVVHKHGKPGWEAGWPPANPNAGIVFHQHGRYGPGVKPEEKWAIDKENKAIRVVSTINLLPWVADRIDRWFPPPMDLDWIDEIGEKAERTGDSIVIAHTPTDRPRKDTVHFLNVCKELRKKYPKVVPVLVERTTHEECMKIRAEADIVYDQLLLQYGTSGLEGMSLGIPVVAGCSASTWDRLVAAFDHPPFVRADKKSLFKVLSRLIESRSMRSEYGQIGREYVEKWHAFEPTAKRAIETYKEAIEYARTGSQRN